MCSGRLIGTKHHFCKPVCRVRTDKVPRAQHSSDAVSFFSGTFYSDDFYHQGTWGLNMQIQIGLDLFPLNSFSFAFPDLKLTARWALAVYLCSRLSLQRLSELSLLSYNILHIDHRESARMIGLLWSSLLLNLYISIPPSLSVPNHPPGSLSTVLPRYQDISKPICDNGLYGAPSPTDCKLAIEQMHNSVSKSNRTVFGDNSVPGGVALPYVSWFVSNFVHQLFDAKENN